MQRFMKMASVVAAIVALGVPVTLSAAVDMYLKIDGVDGESQKLPGGWSDLAAFDWGVVMERDAASGLPTGRRQHKPVTVTKPIDKATPIIMRAAVDGDTFPTADIALHRAGETEPFLRYRLREVVVSSYNMSSSCTDPAGEPLEELALTYSSLSSQFMPPDTGGTGVLELSEFLFGVEPAQTTFSVPAGAVLDGAVFTLEGRELQRVSVSGPVKVADLGLSPGIYVLRVRVVPETGGSGTFVTPVVAR